MENGRKIHNINIIDRLKVPANGRTGYLMILEVEYESGLPSLYQLGLTFGEKTEIHRYGVPTPQGIIAEASLNEVEGFLYDGLFDPSLQKQLLLDIAEKKKAKSAKGQIRLKGDRAMSKYIKNTDEIRTKNLLSRHT
jgi:maltose alpha-D-glucosyltransferase/alpha-amylase